MLQKRFFFNWNQVAGLREEFNNDVFGKYSGRGWLPPGPSPLSGPMEEWSYFDYPRSESFPFEIEILLYLMWYMRVQLSFKQQEIKGESQTLGKVITARCNCARSTITVWVQNILAIVFQIILTRIAYAKKYL